MEPIYAALFKVGYSTVFAMSDTLNGLVDQICDDQDLACLSMHARTMGSAKDAKTAELLDDFLGLYYSGSLTVEDVKNLNLHFSIGQIECLAFASGKEAADALREAYLHRK